MDDLAEMFADLFARYDDGLRRYAWSMGDGDDLTGQLWLSVWQSRHTLDPTQNVHNWLVRSLRNKAIDAKRRRAVRVTEVPLDEIAALASSDEAPDVVAERADRAVTVHALLRQLPPLQAVALWLCYGQSMTHVEAAALLGWPLGTVKTRIFLGRKTLRKLWDVAENEANVA